MAKKENEVGQVSLKQTDDLIKKLSSRVAKVKELVRTAIDKVLTCANVLDQMVKSRLENLKACGTLEVKLRVRGRV